VRHYHHPLGSAAVGAPISGGTMIVTRAGDRGSGSDRDRIVDLDIKRT
jgi:hypothetical protein